MKNKEKPGYFAILPANVRYDNRLKASEKLLYAEITALSNKSGYCWASNKYFAELYDVSKRSITEWVSSLEKYGYIDSKLYYKENSKQVLKRSLTPIEKNFHTPGEENFHTPIEENFQDSTSLNNTSKDNNTSKNIKNSCEREEYPTISKLERTEGGHRKYPEKFEKIYNAYPSREGAANKGGGYTKFRARIKEGISFEQLLKSVENYYVEQARKRSINTKYVMQMKKFFGAKDIWLEYAEKDMSKGGSNGKDKVSVGAGEKEKGTGGDWGDVFPNYEG